MTIDFMCVLLLICITCGYFSEALQLITIGMINNDFMCTSSPVLRLISHDTITPHSKSGKPAFKCYEQILVNSTFICFTS